MARTSFARVLAQTTPVLLLDEPTAALDIRHQEAVLRVARDASLAGAAVVVVLHDLSLAAAHADRICVLAAGVKRADGPPRDVLDPSLLGEIYRHPVDVIDHQGIPVVVPARTEVPCAPTH
jgi:iron complex transport system ATP-binding protein